MKKFTARATHPKIPLSKALATVHLTTPVKEHEAYHIRDYQSGDETAIAELFPIVFGQPLTESQWRWKYTGAGLTQSPPARLAFDSAGRLMGHAGAIPLRGWRNNRPLPFFQICDVMVHPAARGQLGRRNLFAQLARELLSGLAERWPDAFAYGFPGQRPFRLGEYVGVYGRVEQAPVIHRSPRRGSFPLLYTRPLAWEDPQLDGLWARLASSFALALIRDRDYLRWRYATHPSRSYELMGLHLAGQFLGWAVTRRNEERLLVVDLLVSRRWLKPVLAALDRAALASGAKTVELWLPRGWRETGNGQQELTEVIVTNMIWRLPVSTREVIGNLYYTMGDLDIF